MSYKLDGTTLPTPKSFFREQIEQSGTIVTLNGYTKKDITNRKERFTLGFEMLTQAQVSTILTIWGDQTTKTFEVDESNLTVSPTTVHIDIKDRSYNTKGEDYREDLKLILTEVL